MAGARAARAGAGRVVATGHRGQDGDGELPLWHEASGNYFDPATGEACVGPLPGPLPGAGRQAPFGAAHLRAESEASRWLSFKATEITQGEWIAPELAKKKFHEYAGEWMRDRVLKVRTEELYRGLLRNHLLPTFGELGMGDIDEGAVRRWRKERLEAGKSAKRPFGPVTVAKAYRLLHAVFTTAVDEDRIVRRNPCRIEGLERKSRTNGKSSPCPSCSRSPKPSR